MVLHSYKCLHQIKLRFFSINFLALQACALIVFKCEVAVKLL